ncbi:sensor histidine kinase [Planomonospora venezuelensis]|uniref:histidine kinase n=1 Tax=Planomonospora venezuelensis TaxID=1999 RepID=A0A841DJ50_PLAVE|nr:HAMP domain-containing sensor histidine kinase [Planomonospora venezuelensis]MBB5967166.1 signal transduction histidine kinase [Planomonospora venezuelensis]GIN02934.1 sensor histidine kinase [Planomonospora venezuelensis]
MTSLPWPSDETGRLQELRELHVLDVVLEGDFRAIAEVVAYVCRTPIGVVNLMDADYQHFKGRHGIDLTGIGRRQMSFCSYAIRGRDVLEVHDAQADERFRRDPAVQGEPYMRFYAGAPIVTTRGHALGAVFAADHRPRRLRSEQRRILSTLAAGVAHLAELHHHARRAELVEHRLRHLEELKNQFLRTVNHELRTPLTSIRSYLQLVQDGDLDETTEQKFLRVIDRNSARLGELLDRLLLIASLNARTVPFTPASADLAELARQAAGSLAERARAGELTMTVHAPAPVMACADPVQARYAIEQLLDNAVKFTPPGGRVEIVVHAGSAPAVEVRDTGVGIDPGEIDRVREDFYRGAGAEERAIGGAGIGLSLAEKIARMHGGDVQIDSRPGHGTRVRLTLPGPHAVPAVRR